MKTYSIRGRIVLALGQMIVGSLGLLLAFFLFSNALVWTGVLVVGDSSSSIPFEQGSFQDIEKTLEASPYDYQIYNEREQILTSRIMEKDAAYYTESLRSKESIERDSAVYQYQSLPSGQLVLLRLPYLPEFRSHSLRAFLSYNQFSYLFIFLGEILLIFFILRRLIGDLLRNFHSIQALSLQIGEKEAPLNLPVSIREFQEIQTHLGQKSQELYHLIEAEREEKQDLSFQVAAFAHDIKTPLTVLKGNMELLEMTNLSEQQLEFLDSMKESSQRVETYFHAMIDYTRLLGQTQVVEQVNLQEFIEELTFQVEDLFLQEQVDWQVEISESCPELVYFAPMNVHRALVNILTNAGHYARKDDKQVRLLVEANEKFLSFLIWNNGPHFSQDSLDHANKLFYTEDKARSGTHYGIGLAFAQAVATAHDGQLQLENLEQGVRVTFSIRKKTKENL